MAENTKYSNLDNLDQSKPENPPTFNFNPAPLQYKPISPEAIENIKKEAEVKHVKNIRLVAPIIEETCHLVENITKHKSEVAKILLENIELQDKVSKIKNLMLTWVTEKISDPTPNTIFTRNVSLITDKDISDTESHNFFLEVANKSLQTVNKAYSYHTLLRDILVNKDLTDEQKVEEMVNITI